MVGSHSSRPLGPSGDRTSHNLWRGSTLYGRRRASRPPGTGSSDQRDASGGPCPPRGGERPPRQQPLGPVSPEQLRTRLAQTRTQAGAWAVGNGRAAPVARQ